MFGNRDVTVLSLMGVVIMALGTVLGLIAVATTDWVLAPMKVVVSDSPDVDGSTCRVGLWEICCSDTNSPNECFASARQVSVEIQVLRIMLTISVCWMAVSVIAVLVYIFKDFRNRSEGAKQCVSFIFSTATVMYLIIVFAYAMKEYKSDPGFFTVDGEPVAGTSFEWSFFMALVGALITPIGVFLVCTQWHKSEDTDAGVEHDYDGKFTEDTYI